MKHSPTLIDPKEIDSLLGIKMGDFSRKCVEKLIKLDKLNQIYTLCAHHTDPTEVVEDILKHLNIKVSCDVAFDKVLAHPGPLLIAANHPTGLAETGMLSALLRRMRPNIKVLANQMICRCSVIGEFTIPFDAFQKDKRHNLLAIRTAQKHLQEGHDLLIFPAGEVSHHKKFGRVQDHPWSNLVAYLAAETNAKIVTLHVEAKNPLSYYILSKLHPYIKAALIIRTFFKHGKKPLKIVSGYPLSISRKMYQQSKTSMTRWLYHLNHALPEINSLVSSAALEYVQPTKLSHQQTPLAPLPTKSAISAAIAKVSELCIYQKNAYKVFATTAQEMGEILVALQVEREAAFRQVGMGTGKSIDMQAYDEKCLHLFLWHAQTQQIISGCRLLYIGAEQFSQNFQNSYLSELYHLKNLSWQPDAGMLELSRVFIAKSQQKNPYALPFLWRGIGKTLLSYGKNCRYMFGLTSFSPEDHPPVITHAFLKYLQIQCKLAPAWTQQFSADHPLDSAFALPEHATEAVKLCQSMKQLEETLWHWSGKRYPLPNIYKMYEALSGFFSSISIDENFSNCVDVLTFVDFAHANYSKIKHYFTAEEILQLKAMWQ